jgi:hypothetical protein
MGPMKWGECDQYRSYTKGVLEPGLDFGEQFWTSAACRMVVRNVGPVLEPWGIFHVIARSTLIGPIS